MLSRRRGEYPHDGFFPQPHTLQKAASLRHFTLLVPKHALHLALVVDAKIKRQYPDQKSENLL